MTPDEIARRATRAQQLLSDKLLVEALDTIEEEIIEQWEACPARDTEGREALWKYYKTAKKFRNILQGAVESGKVAAFRERSLTESAFNMFRKTAA
jgi:hypothetical protein